MNILVVDDEPIIRIGLRTLVDWDKHGLSLAAEAADGREALERIRAGGIDIVLTDIRMPRMDGLELIRVARAEQDDLGVLVLSCLDDFAFVKEAMKLGASDYVLKPTMEPDELVAILLEMKRRIGDNREAKRRMREWQDELAESRQAQLALWLRRFIDEGAVHPKLERELFGQRAPLYSLLLIGADEALAAGESAAACIAAASAVRFGGGLLILLPLASGLSQREAYAAKFAGAQALNAQLREAGAAAGGSWTIGIGPDIASLPQLRQALEAHRRQLRRRFYGEPAAIVADAGEEPPEGELPHEHRSSLLRAMSSRNIDAMRHHAELLCGDIRERKPDIARLRTFLFELMGLLVGFARDHGFVQLDRFERKHVSLTRIQSFYEADALCRWFRDAVQELWGCRWGQASEGAANNPFIRKALQFMHDNYRRNIGTTDIADHVRLSRSYLSDLYSREMGESLIETLTRIRIDQAKALLRSGDKKVYEIADAVGFTDPKSFAKTFKRIVGCTPKEYESENK